MYVPMSNQVYPSVNIAVLRSQVVVTFFVGSSINHKVTNNFSFIGESFLMGTVAIGGIVNVMPLLYGKIESTAVQVRVVGG